MSQTGMLRTLNLADVVDANRANHAETEMGQKLKWGMNSPHVRSCPENRLAKKRACLAIRPPTRPRLLLSCGLVHSLAGRRIIEIEQRRRRWLLAPDIVELIIDGTQPPAMTLATLMRPLPATWNGQRSAIERGTREQ